MATEYWVCDFGCGYHSESKRDVETHEDNCDLNPIVGEDIEEEIFLDEEG
jgi:hypothetical protein